MISSLRRQYSWAAGAVLVALSILVPMQAGAQPRNLLFRHLSADDGLSQATVKCILQDRYGFMWFGTEDGLNRYDGYGFTVFRHNDLEPQSLAHNLVETLVEDPDGSIWVGTQNGLDRFDPDEERFEHFRHDPADDASLSQNRIVVTFIDRAGNLWVGTEDRGLNRFNRADGNFTRYLHDPEDRDSLSSNRISAVVQDESGAIWVGTRDAGLNRLDPVTGRFERFRHLPSDENSLSSDSVSAIHEGHGGVVWVGTRDGGLNRVDRESGHVQRFRHHPEDRSSLSSDHVGALFAADARTLWVGTSRGLNELRTDDGIVYRYRRNPMEPASLIDDEVVSLFLDRGGVMWVGTGKGLSRWNTQTEAFGYANESFTGLSHNIVTSFAQERDGTLWVGTFGGGVNRIDRRSGAVTHYRNDPGNPRSLSDDRAMSVLVDREDRVWVGTFGGGLNRYDGDGGFERFRNDSLNPDSLSEDGVVTIFEDRAGSLWVGTFEGGLNRLDRETGRFEHFRQNPLDSGSLSEDRIQTLFEDRDGNLWVGTDGGGLNRFDRETSSFTVIRHDPLDSAALSSDSIYSIAEDEVGRLWIGTEQGLNEWSRSDREAGRPRFRVYRERHGLPNEVVYGALPDGQGHLWLSTNRGLSRLDLEARSFESFGRAHGLQGNEFNFGAYFRSRSGEMFFGGVNGFNYFFPEHIRDNQKPPPVVLTGLYKLNEPVLLGHSVVKADVIDVGFRDYVVTFEFAALDYTAPEQNEYAYKLEGFNDDWIELGNVRRATYTNLDAGSYVFRVKGSNNDGVWNETGARIAVQVQPAPWETWWAYSLYGLLALGLFVSYARAQAKKLEREAEHAQLLERQVQERTHELEEKNQDLVVANELLEKAAITDSLTGLYNRRYLATHLQQELTQVTERYESARSKGSPSDLRSGLLFLMTDLDGLKKINDVHGHLAGDLAIVQMCELLRRSCRASDTVIRWGGDEFMVVGRDLNREGAEALAERIREAVTGHEFDLGDGVRLRLSCSIGFTFFPFLLERPGMLSSDQVLSIADQALYAAKRSGRNAWVGIFGKEGAPAEDASELTLDDLEVLEANRVIELSTSLTNREQLVLSG